MHQTLRVAAQVTGIVIAVACNSSLEPGIELRTEVTPALVDAGDTVTLRAILHNTSRESIEPGGGCGPPVLFEMRSGVAVVHPIPLDGIFICPALDYHRLEPGETDTVLVRWRADLPSGDWSVRSGFREWAGLARLTPAVQLTVR